MITHDIEEAIYLSDRIVVLSNGPSATVFDTVQVDIPRPRIRSEMIKNKEYLDIKDRLLYYLTSVLRKTA
jgi:ABC-type nitrate/sulfonate/bicarbonate transport system ATPase subunit